MTERQIKLKDEIMKIADELQLGIYQDDPDWFFKFIQRMRWGELDDINDLSLDFIREFMGRFDWRLNWIKNKNKLPISEILPLLNSTYIMTLDWITLKMIGQSDELTDDLVLEYEKLFDQTCDSRNRNGAPGGSDYTAWHYISNNPKLSPKIREMAAKKMQYNQRNGSRATQQQCCSQSFLEKIFCS